VSYGDDEREGSGPDDEGHQPEDRRPDQAGRSGNDSGGNDGGYGGNDGRPDEDHESAADEGPPRTGDPAVDAALAAAAAVRGAAPAEQLETYVGTHRSLQDRLADSGA
jgi:hypothetical protein